MSRHTKRHKIPTTYVDGIAIREQSQKGCVVYSVDYMRNGIRKRKAFGNIEDAKTYAKLKSVELRNFGTSALTITDRQRVELDEVVKMLKGRATLTEVVGYWIERHPDGTSETWEETATRYLAAMRDGNRRETSQNDKAIKLNILTEALGNPPTCSVDKRAIEDAVNRLGADRGWAEQTKHVYAAAGMTLVRFYKGEGKRMIKTDDKPPSTWDAKFIAALMHKAEKITPSIVPALAVLTFAGLRPHEAMRISWDVVNFTKDIISLTGETTKTRESRHVKIAPNLKRWLLAYPGAGKLVSSPIKYRTEREKLMRAMKIIEWPTDVLRHTFATMTYARTKSVDETCVELGHFSTGMFLKHYKGLAPLPDDVAKFWAISPKLSQKK